VFDSAGLIPSFNRSWINPLLPGTAELEAAASAAIQVRPSDIYMYTNRCTYVTHHKTEMIDSAGLIPSFNRSWINPLWPGTAELEAAASAAIQVRPSYISIYTYRCTYVTQTRLNSSGLCWGKYI